MRELRIRRARKAAAALLRRYGADETIPVPIEEVAWALGAAIEHSHIDGALALLARVGQRAWIRVSDTHDHPGQLRFSIAHELGHLVLSHDGLTVCTRQSMRGLDDLDAEAEANAFAADVLLPEHLLKRRCEVSPVNLDVVGTIAEEFDTSLVASAIRFVELTSERCAVVLSRAGRVQWAARSKLFWPEIRRGQYVMPSALAHDYFRTGRITGTCEPVDATAWVSGDRLRGPAELFEHAKVLPQLEAVLSMVWIPESCTELAFRDR